MVAGRNNKAGGRETAFDMGGGVDFERATGHEIADEAALDDRVAHHGFGVQDKALFLDDQAAMRAEILRNGLRDLIVA